MESLFPNLELSPISTKSPKPTSFLLSSPRFSSLKSRIITKKWSVSVPCVCSSSPSVKKTESKLHSNGQDFIKSVGKGVIGFAAAATTLASVCYDAPAFAESLTVAFPVSRAPEVPFLLLYINLLYRSATVSGDFDI